MRIEKGDVLRMDFEGIPHPKIFIIVGEAEDNLTLASVFVNSEINPIHRGTPELMALQYEIHPSDYDFLHHKSYIDCAELILRERKELEDLLSIDPSRKKGRLTAEQEDELKKNIINSDNIKGKIKKKYGFYDD